MLSKVFQVIYFIIDFLLLGLKKKGGQQWGENVCICHKILQTVPWDYKAYARMLTHQLIKQQKKFFQTQY